MTACPQRRPSPAGDLTAGSAGGLVTAGLAGLAVDLLAFQALFFLGAGLTGAQLSSFCLAALCSFALGLRAAPPHRGVAEPALRFLVVGLLALALRGGVLACLAGVLHLPVQPAVLAAIGASAVVTSLGLAYAVFSPADSDASAGARWRLAAIGVAAYAAALRLVFLGSVELLPQEAYYWNYAQHLDIGYLDHPPMVAWLVWAGTFLFGSNEFGVRIAAWLCWAGTAFFGFRLAGNLFGRTAAFVTLLLVAALPFYFATGLVMTPDAPLTLGWAGALYFLERALRGGQGRAWLGAGACLGFGLLSKYTIALLAPATFLFMLLDARARVWFRRPQPYLGAALALVLFAPVILWNMENGLASFAFQSTRRMEGALRFSSPELLLGAAGLLTPTGLVAALGALWPRGRGGSGKGEPGRAWLFTAVFTLVPLSVFVVFSVFHMARLNWTGPLWLAVLPAVAAGILAASDRRSAWQRHMRRAWAPTLAVSLVVYGLGLNGLTFGLPGLATVAPFPAVPVAWQAFGRQAADIAGEVRKATGQEPVLIGLDAYHIASELAFYDHGGQSVGRGVVGQPGLMFGYWYRPEELQGRPAILFAFTRGRIENPLLNAHFADSGEVMQRDLVDNGRAEGRFYYRVGHLTPSPAAQAVSSR